MKFLLILGTLIFNFVPNDARISEALKVTLSHGGELIGKYLSSHSGNGIRAFMGIPYAEPPIRSLRFNNPVPKAPWVGALEVNREPLGCLSYDYLFDGNVSVGSEDCLYLNVYVPLRPLKKGPLPVMVFFHGGGFQSGNGGKTLYGPDYLLDHDVILVTGNYRLGVFGFFSTNTPDCPGNFGLKDQVEILKWVQNNIETFGGDKNSVTIFGESAGGASVTFHTISPLSQGLFHRVISQSGTHFTPWALQSGKIAAKRARKLASVIKCPDEEENVKEMIECLRCISAKEINSHFYDFFEWNIFPIIYWGPIVEPPNQYRFLDDDPWNVTRGNDIPVIIGLTTNEGVMISVSLLKSQKSIEDIQSQSNRLIPYILSMQDYSTATKNNITTLINEFYFNNNEVDMRDSEMFNRFTDVLSDGFFLTGVENFLQQRLQESLSSNTYLYLFNHKGESSFSELFLNDHESEHGVSHMDDLIYLFPVMKENFFKGVPTEIDDNIRQSIVTLWVNFAEFGNPTPFQDKNPQPLWNAAGSFPYDYLRIGNYNSTNKPILAMEHGLYEERAKLWKKITSIMNASEIETN
ncbi:juvenile hormone esterase-like [Phlebotomus papatasi]|uniref:juvenile hormone esterase-like n=1 Tax=Phlebotomus papatasi TaxID=29031 RepID=UPI002483CCF9|nr:juvenile hormone esterase-like [Phlebotomus papatasi]